MRQDLEEDEDADGGDRAAQEQRYRALFADRTDDGSERHGACTRGRRITQDDLAAVDQTGFDMHEILRAFCLIPRPFGREGPSSLALSPAQSQVKSGPAPAPHTESGQGCCWPRSPSPPPVWLPSCASGAGRLG